MPYRRRMKDVGIERESVSTMAASNGLMAGKRGLVMGVVAVPLAVRLWRLVASDGLGAVPAPRSHGAELGSWIDRELGR